MPLHCSKKSFCKNTAVIPLCTCLAYEVSAAYAYLPQCNSCLQFTKTPKCIHQFACVIIHLGIPPLADTSFHPLSLLDLCTAVTADRG